MTSCRDDILDEQAREIERLRAQRDELVAAVQRLPEPPPEVGDGPDERVGYAVELLDGATVACHGLAGEMGRLRRSERRLAAGLIALRDLIRESEGVAGFHLNGDVASWSELLQEGSALAPASDAFEALDALAAQEERS